MGKAKLVGRKVEARMLTLYADQLAYLRRHHISTSILVRDLLDGYVRDEIASDMKAHKDADEDADLFDVILAVGK